MAGQARQTRGKAPGGSRTIPAGAQQAQNLSSRRDGLPTGLPGSRRGDVEASSQGRRAARAATTAAQCAAVRLSTDSRSPGERHTLRRRRQAPAAETKQARAPVAVGLGRTQRWLKRDRVARTMPWIATRRWSGPCRRARHAARLGWRAEGCVMVGFRLCMHSFDSPAAWARCRAVQHGPTAMRT